MLPLHQRVEELEREVFGLAQDEPEVDDDGRRWFPNRSYYEPPVPSPEDVATVNVAVIAEYMASRDRFPAGLRTPVDDDGDATLRQEPLEVCVDWLWNTLRCGTWLTMASLSAAVDPDWREGRRLHKDCH